MLPGWVADWRQASAEYAIYRHLQLDLQDVFGHTFGLVVAAVLALTVFTVLWRNRRCQPQSTEFGLMCALALAVTVCILPTELAMVYNHVLLFPACFILLEIKPLDPQSYAALARRAALGLVAWSFVSIDVAVLGETLGRPSDFWDGLPCQTHILATAIVVAMLIQLMEEKKRVPTTKLIPQQQPA